MNKKIILLFFVIIAFVFWNIVLPGPRAANDFPLTFDQSLKEGFALPSTWNRVGSNFGGYAVSTLWSWPIDVLYGVGGQLEIPFAVLLRFFGVIPALLLGAWSMWKLLSHYNVPIKGKVVGSTFYILNAYFVLLLDGGQYAIALAYGIMPWVYLSFNMALKGNSQSKMFSGLLVAILGFLDIRFIYVLGIILIVKLIFQLCIERQNKGTIIKSWTLTGIVASVIFVLLHAYWLLPAVLSRSPQLPTNYDRTSQLSFLSFASIGNAMQMLQPHWYKNIFGQITLGNPLFLAIPFFAFLAPIVHRKNMRIAFWTTVALLGIFLVKGTLDPAPQIYSWLFANIPGFALFRDPTKFFFIVGLAYAILLAFTFQKMPHTAVAIAIIYLVLLMHPVFTLQMTGTLAPSRNVQSYDELHDYLKNNESEFSRTLWVPSHATLGYSSPNMPLVDANNLLSKRPFAISVFGTYETNNFLRESPFITDLFQIAAIKHVVYPHPDTGRTQLKTEDREYFTAFWNQLSQRPWVQAMTTFGSGETFVGVIETPTQPKHIFLTQDVWAVVGSDRIYYDLSERVNIENIGLSFVEEQPGILDTLSQISTTKIVLYNKSFTDLYASFIPSNEFISPATMLNFSPNKTGWWKREASDLISWKNFLMEKYALYNIDFDYGQGWAISEGSHTLDVVDNRIAVGEKLFARVMFSAKSGSVRFMQNGTVLSELNTNFENPTPIEIPFEDSSGPRIFEYTQADFHWIEIGDALQNGQLTIETDGDINVINAIASVSYEQWNTIREKAKKLEPQVYLWGNVALPEQNNAQVTYKKVKPTEYVVEVTNAASPQTIVFSESHDRLWKIKNEQGYSGNAFPLYSMVNGFAVPGNGVYTIYFEPQKYIPLGLIISGISFITLLGYLAYTSYNGKQNS